MTKARKEFLKFRTLRGISVNYRWIMTKYGPHYHSAAEFTIALKDNCRFKVAGKEYTLNTNDILLVWPNDIHETIDIELNSTLIVHFSSDIIDCNLDLVSALPIMSNYHKIDHTVDKKLADDIADRMFRIRELYDNKTFFSETKSKMLVDDMLVMIGEHLSKRDVDELVQSPASEGDKKHIRAALTYIDEHFMEGITQTEVAEYVGLSPYYFSRMFKKIMNKNISSYISEVRLKYAIGIMADDSMTIMDCAFKSGFQSITAFNRAFKECFGCSPSEYRKSNIKGRKKGL